MLSTAHPSVLKTITKTIIPNKTEKRGSVMWIKYTKSVSRYKKQTQLHGTNESRTTQSTSKEDTLSSKCSLLKEDAGLLFNQITHLKFVLSFCHLLTV